MSNLRQLPYDKNAQSTPQELELVNSIFSSEESRADVYHEIRPILYSGIIFVIFSLPFIDMLISSTLPFAQGSRIVRLAIKTILFMLFLYTVILWCDPTK